MLHYKTTIPNPFEVTYKTFTGFSEIKFI